ncbi:MAG: UvrD/REP helicase [Microgenomates group bacterium GW2011_GWF2_47_9]|nr:MAG: UvrD/REP helicase [Microgenomates group bacterium GW2011_GWF2_47_9]
MKITKAFETAYKELNNEQKLAVDTLDGPIMVVAGPGTGKTQTLALRIANILLKTDTDPDAILALTFTESAAKEMRERLTRFIGAAAYYINISTFHSFCVDVIKTHPSHFTIDPSVEPLSDLEKLKILRRLIDHGKMPPIIMLGPPFPQSPILNAKI